MNAPERPTELPRRAWWGVLKRTLVEFKDDNVQDWAAALTYYGVLSIFPALIVLVALFAMLGRDETSNLLGSLAVVTPTEVETLLNTSLEGVKRQQKAAGALAIVGVAVALWSASGYIGAFGRAANAIFDIEEGRPFWKLTPLRLGLTLLVMILLVAGAIAVSLTGTVAEVAGRVLGIDDTFVRVWDIAKWPVLVLIAMGLIMVLYWASPNVRHPGFRWITPGGIIAIVLWVLVSAGFGLYVANFASYDKTYGTLATVVIFLIWLWLSNLALLFGAEFDAELARGRKIAEGSPAQAEPYAVPRDPPKPDTLPE